LQKAAVTAPCVYVNLMSGDQDDRVPEAYRTLSERLVALESRYVPTTFSV